MSQSVREVYPKATTREEISNKILASLSSYGQFDPKRTLWAVSDCSDEANRSTTRFQKEHQIDNVFQLGGLAGYPFAGETGFRAFASHVPENGAAILLYGPHIGISRAGHVGYMKRIGQSDETTCCGALHGTLNRFASEEATHPDPEMDYQMWYIDKALEEQTEQILAGTPPIVEITDRMYRLIDDGVSRLLESTHPTFGDAYVVLVGGIFINRDQGEEDWFDLRRFEVVAPDGSRTNLKK
ncbi:MAG: hypothetical protein ACQER4_00630 [Bacteroidota bacterium]